METVGTVSSAVEYQVTVFAFSVGPTLRGYRKAMESLNVGTRTSEFSVT